MFNKFFGKENSESSTPSGQSGWDTLEQEVPFNNQYIEQISQPQESRDEEPIAPNLRQQDKLIKVILTGNTDLFSQSSVDVSPQERDSLLYYISNQSVDDRHFNNAISWINGPSNLQSAEDIFNRNIDNDKHSRRILAAATGVGFKNYNAADNHTLEAFYNRFPQPFNFDEFSKVFLADIKAQNPPQKYQEYLQSMHDFKHAVYGKKQEYYDQAKLLRAEAARRFPPAQPQEQYQEQPQEQYQEQYQYQAESMDNLRPIESLLETATFDNSPFVYKGREYHLTTEHLKQANLEPHHELRMEGYRIGFSDGFNIGSHDACLGYVESPDGKVTVRPYYRSNSAGVWRYLPDYKLNDKGNIWYGKGPSEESCTLPFEFQEKLNYISQQRPANLNNILPLFVFAGAAHRIDVTNEEYAVMGKNGTLPGDFYREVNGSAYLNFGQISEQKDPPDGIDVYGEFAPNFDQSAPASYVVTREYGNTAFKPFSSWNQRLRYIMGEAMEYGERRAWLSDIEVSSSKLTSTGCRAAWVSIGDIGTPLHEYRKQSDGYGEEFGSGSYVDMWSKYLSRMPFIRRYLDLDDK
jgi:hypothetical protein